MPDIELTPPEPIEIDIIELVPDLELTPPDTTAIEILDLEPAIEQLIDGKAPKQHAHLIDQINGLQAALDQKNVLINGAIQLHKEDLQAHSHYIDATEFAVLQDAVTEHQAAFLMHQAEQGAGGHIPDTGISNQDVAPMAAISWTKINKEGATPAQVGAAPAVHTHPGIPIIADTASPAPAVGDRWLHPAARRIWFWNGAYWLSEQVFEALFPAIEKAPIGGNIATTQLATPVAIDTAYNLYHLNLIAHFTCVGATYSASNRWELALRRLGATINQ